MKICGKIQTPAICFFEDGGPAKGKRLTMKRIAVETNTEKVMKLKKEHFPEDDMDGKRNLHLVTFKVSEGTNLMGIGD